MSRLVARAETWERVYNAFQNVNFAAFDYNTVKRSVLDYMKLYFPETFNDFIESSELIAIVEIFAYIAELMAYRIDVNANENFISTAQRKDSILRLAKLVSYTASRQLPARGLVKITSVTTTESIIDANGNDLSNRAIRWNDLNNTNWKDQFTLVMNRVLDQDFGSVSPTDRFQIQDILFETYSFNLSPVTGGVLPYTAVVNDKSVAMELVPVVYDTALGIVERRPQANSNFTLLYGQDGLGDASTTTGFFLYTKQGTLQRFRATFDGITPNQTYDVALDDVNDTDVWFNKVDPATGQIFNDPSELPYRRETVAGRSGEWVQVDMAHSQNVIFNTNPKRNKYEVETRANNRIRLNFGDGEFADIPNGTFDIWVRTSLDEDILVPQSAVSNKTSAFTYVDPYGRTQTFSFTFSLVSSLQNASAAEDIEHVRETAPAVYYSQDRMVNGEDYNVFPLQDPSILKLRSINRTFAGDSKYITWHDASGTYENVKIFSDDGIIYFEEKDITVTTPAVTSDVLVNSYVQPLLSSTDMFLQFVAHGVAVQDIRRIFNTTELSSISSSIAGMPPVSIHLYYNLKQNQWYAVKGNGTITDPYPVGLGNIGYHDDPALSDFINTPLIKITQLSPLETKYNVVRTARRLIFQSPTTKFWNEDSSNAVVNYNTMHTSRDTINVLQSNLNHNRNGSLANNWKFYVLGQEIITAGQDIGLPDENRIAIIPEDTNQDGIPDNYNIDNYLDPAGLSDILMPKLTYTSTGVKTLPVPYVVGRGDVQIVNVSGTGAAFAEIGDQDTISSTINITSLGGNTKVLVAVRDYVYFSRQSISDQWVPAPPTIASISSYVSDRLALTNLWKREEGRTGLHFAWFHNSDRYYLVDPSPSNLIDMFVIPKGYFLSLKRWLEDPLADKPVAPTSLDLRTSYGYLLDNKMISDTVILHPGNFKLLFGSRAEPQLQAVFKVVRSSDKTLTDNQIKTILVTTVRNFFDVTKWEFGETFYTTELIAAIHAALSTEISSVVLVPVLIENHFGNMFQVFAREDELFYPDIGVNDIEIVTSLNANTLNISQEQLILACAPISAPVPATYSLTTNVPQVNEGASIQIILTTQNVPDGTVVTYTLSGPGITANDFVTGALTGNFLVINNTATVTLDIKADMLTEGTETVTVSLDNGGANCTFQIIDTSTTPLVPTYVLSTTAPVVNGLPQVNEGDTVPVTLTTTNLTSGTALGYTVTGINSSDLRIFRPVGSAVQTPDVTGNFIVGSDGTSILTFYIRADATTEGTEVMSITLNNGQTVPLQVRIMDTSTSAAPAPTPAPSSAVLSVTPTTKSVSGIVGTEINAGQFTMTNTGTGTLTISAITVSSQYATYRRTGTYITPLTLDTGASASFTLYMTPSSTGLTTSSSITFQSNGGTVVVPLSISATSTGPVIVKFDANPSTITIGDTVNLEYLITGDSASTTLSDGATTNYVTTSMGTLRTYTGFKPTTTGVSTFVISGSDGTNYKVATTNVQVNDPGLGISPTSISFNGSIGSSTTTAHIALYNDSLATATISSITVSNPHGTYTVDEVSLPLVLPSNQSIMFTLTVTPSTSGSFSDTVVTVVSDIGTRTASVIMNIAAAAPPPPPPNLTFTTPTVTLAPQTTYPSQAVIFSTSPPPGGRFIASAVKTAGTLPPSMYLDVDWANVYVVGHIDGDPATSTPQRSYPFTVHITDNLGTTYDQTGTVVVTAYAAPPPPAMVWAPASVALDYGTFYPNLVVQMQTNVSATPRYLVGSGALIAGALPAGMTLSIDASHVYISGGMPPPGTSLSATTANFTVRVTDVLGTTYDLSCVVVINAYVYEGYPGGAF